MFRLKDRKGADMALAMTHEEVVTWLAAREIQSYKQLPQLWYHIQTKERDEARPKSGILRTREFLMKDSYSLDVSDEGLQASYRKHIGAYDRIYERCGVAVMMVDEDSGMMGGDVSHAYMAFAEAGEDEIVYCESCGYAANVELAVARAAAPGGEAEGVPAAEAATPGARTIAEVGALLGLPARAFCKALVVMSEAQGPLMVLVRGDRELNELKLRRLVGEFRMATADEVLDAQGVEPGFVGPIPTTLPIIADDELRAGVYVAGANKSDYHRGGVRVADLPGVRFADLRQARPGDACASCDHGELLGARVIEVGNIFQLGTKYSEPMGARFIAENGEEQPIIMGSYGIGLARIAAAAVEQHHDDHGIIWPANIAPWHVHVVLVRASDEVQRALAERVYEELQAARLEVLYDERDLSPGIKFKDADLLGCPLQVVIGKRAVDGVVEVKDRRTGERTDVSADALVATLRAALAAV
jgi:prolyl-tRNA synthetase